MRDQPGRVGEQALAMFDPERLLDRVARALEAVAPDTDDEKPPEPRAAGGKRGPGQPPLVIG